jgi:hypothetical protein
MAMRLPIKTDALVFMVAKVEPVLDHRTGEMSVDRESRQPFYRVHLMVISQDGKPEVWSVKLLGEPKGLSAGMPVSVVGLVAMDWEQGDRHGLAFRAESIVAVGAGAHGGAAKVSAA